MIYIQSNKEKTLPHHFDCACALYGAMDSAMDYRLVTFEEVQSGKFDLLIKNNLFVGSVEFMREVFNRIGKIDVRLPKNSNRDSKIITLAEAHEIVSKGEKLFVKPLEIKLFTGLVLDGASYSCLKGLPDDTKVLAYEPFRQNIVSEWRVYVHNHEAIDARHYSGNFSISPSTYDYSLISTIIRLNKKDFPIAYTIDIGLFTSTNFEIIEYNDMWAIGQYGMPNDLYLRLLKDRYFQIVN